MLCAPLFVILAWSLETIIYLYVSGVSLWEKGDRPAILGLVKIVLAHLALISATFIICYEIFRRIKNRVIRQAEKRIKGFRDDALSDFENTLEEKVSAFRAMVE